MISNIKQYIAILLILLFNTSVYAAPSGGNVVHGNAEIHQNGSNTIINQGSNSAIINWESFDINKGESVHFNQNSSSSIVLNRVTNGLPTSIFGNLSANGNVFVLNQAGVLVGNGASINTHSFLAGAASINDKDFINGNYKFYNAQGSVINNGNIKVQNGGYAVLLGKSVENNGLITAKLGKIYLSSGDAFRMDMSGNDLIGVVIEKGADNSLTTNTGKLHAEGGTVVMTAKNASNIIRQAVNNTGIIDASSISYEGGKVILGAENGEIINSGSINVSSESSSAGSIDINGENIINSGYLLANGLNGGNINLYASDLLQIKGTSKIESNAFGYGNGGNIYLISENRAESYNGALIQSNSIYGQGGFIELSGHKSVYAYGDFNTKSLYGAYGVFLLDPSDMFIGNYPNNKDEENNHVSKDGNTYVDITWLNTQLGKNNVVLKTLAGNGAGNITLNSGISISGTKGLTLDAGNNINLLGDISVSDLKLLANGNITGNNAITTSGNMEALSKYGNIQLTKLNITGTSKFNARNGNVYLVGENLGKINQVVGNNVGLEVTGKGKTIEKDATVTDRAVIQGNEISLKADGKIDVSVNTTRLTAESITDSLNIENYTKGETVLLKYLGKIKSNYHQPYGRINLSNISKNSIGADLTIQSDYGTIFAVNRLDDLKSYTNLTLNANIIHFIEENSKPLSITNDLLKGTAKKYIFENIGDISVDIKDGTTGTPLLAASGLEVISKHGKVTTTSPISARYFSAIAYGDITVNSSILGGASFISEHGNINFTHGISVGGVSAPTSGIVIRGLKALNGNIKVTLNGEGSLFVSDVASYKPINFNIKGAEIVSISGSGKTPLNINLKNGIGKAYTLEAVNTNNLIINTDNNKYKSLNLKTDGYLSLSNMNNIVAEDKIHLSASSMAGGNISLKAGNEVYIDLKTGSKSFKIDAPKLDLNGNSLNVELVQNAILTDLNKDDLAGNITGTLNINSKNSLNLDGLLQANNLNVKSKSFTFGKKFITKNADNFKLGIIKGENINITSVDDISGYGKIIGNNVTLTGNTIGANNPILVLAKFGTFTSTAKKKTPDDVLINIGSNDWIYAYKNYTYKTSSKGKIYLAGRIVDPKISQSIKQSRVRGKLPIENTNIDKVEGDDLLKGGRFADTDELITVEKTKQEKVNSIKKRSKNIELK